MPTRSEQSNESDAERTAAPRPAPVEILHGDKNIWIQDELVLLHQLLPEYLAKKKNEKQNFIKTTAWEKIRDIWGDRYQKPALKDVKVNAQWKKKRKQVRNWFSNHSKGSSKIKNLGFRQTTNFSSVVDILHKDAVLTQCDLLSEGAARGSAEWLRHYRKSLQLVRQGLTKEEKQEALETIEKYKEAGYPKDYQAMHAYRYGRAIVKKADIHRFKTMGMRSLTFECHYSEEGDIVFGLCLNERRQIYPTFATFNPTALAKFKEAYVDYATKIYEWDTGNKLDDDLSFCPNDLGSDEKGLPVLPGEFLRDGVEPLNVKRNILRHFVNRHYEIASEHRTKSAPWKEIYETPDQFFSSQYLPQNVRLRDPSHLPAWACTLLVSHWRSKQEMGEVCFKFEHVKQGSDLVEAAYPQGNFKAKLGKPSVAITSPLKKRRRISDTTDQSSEDAADLEDNSGDAGLLETTIPDEPPMHLMLPDQPDVLSDPSKNSHNNAKPSVFPQANVFPHGPTESIHPRQSKEPSLLPQINYLPAQHPNNDKIDPRLLKNENGNNTNTQPNNKEPNDLPGMVLNSRGGGKNKRPKPKAKGGKQKRTDPLFLPDVAGGWIHSHMSSTGHSGTTSLFPGAAGSRLPGRTRS
ncbi:hypothetical protein CPC08DRAFT_730012 [Agrocybe pediades]|nr:hypothetical protein CPC08DRAFT_730012 [Agrocybe pediades]